MESESFIGRDEKFEGWPPSFELGQIVVHSNHEGERGYWFGRRCTVVGRRLNGRYNRYSDGYDYLIRSEERDDSSSTKVVISADLSKVGS